MEKVDISNLVVDQLPDFIQADYETFSDFIKAYYQFIDANYKNDLLSNLDIDKTVDELVDRLKVQYHISDTHENVDDKKLIRHLKELYTLKGTEEAFKLFFKVLFDKDVLLEYPSRDLLVPSQSTYYKKTVILCEMVEGDYNDIVGERVIINSDGSLIELEILGAVQKAPSIIEFEINNNYYGTIKVDDIFYNSDETVFAKILPTIANIEILQPGEGFSVGQLIDVVDPNGSGSGTKIKVLETEVVNEKVAELKIGTKTFEGTYLPIGLCKYKSSPNNSLYFSDGSPHNLADGEDIYIINGIPQLGDVINSITQTFLTLSDVFGNMPPKLNKRYTVRSISAYEFQLVDPEDPTKTIIMPLVNGESGTVQIRIPDKYGCFYCGPNDIVNGNSVVFYDTHSIAVGQYNQFGVQVSTPYFAIGTTRNSFLLLLKETTLQNVIIQ